MNEVKPYNLAGNFYPESKNELQSTIKNLFMSVPRDYNIFSRVLIVPHAAYKYSGEVAANAFQYFDKKIKNVFIFSPAHYLLFYGLALASYKKWSTPLGEISANQELCKEIMEEFDADYNDRAYEQEHAIEVQLPFIQTVLPEAQIIPILFGSSNFSKIQHIVDKYYFNEEIGFVFSSDLTHFYSMEEVNNVDEANADQMEMRYSANYMVTHSNLSTGMVATTEFAREKGYSLIRIQLKTSGEMADSSAPVEGYGSWMVVEEGKQEFIKKEFSDTVLTICRNSIISGFEYKTPINTEALDIAPVFFGRGASYVEVLVDGEIRGCSHSLFPYQTLAEDLAQNAFKAVFENKDHSSITSDEIDKMKLKICLLTRPVPVPFAEEKDLLLKTEAGKDGLIIKDEKCFALFMPSEWTKYSNKEEFINAIKEKAGLSEKGLRNTIEAYKFRAVEIES